MNKPQKQQQTNLKKKKFKIENSSKLKKKKVEGLKSEVSVKPVKIWINKTNPKNEPVLKNKDKLKLDGFFDPFSKILLKNFNFWNFYIPNIIQTKYFFF